MSFSAVNTPTSPLSHASPTLTINPNQSTTRMNLYPRYTPQPSTPQYSATSSPYQAPSGTMYLQPYTTAPAAPIKRVYTTAFSHQEQAETNDTSASRSIDSSSMSVDDGLYSDHLSKDFSFSSYSDVPSHSHSHSNSSTNTNERLDYTRSLPNPTAGPQIFTSLSDTQPTNGGRFWNDLPPQFSTEPPQNKTRYMTTQ